MNKFLSVILVFMMFTACGSYYTVQTDFDKKVAITQFQTFSFNPKGLDKLPFNDLDKRRLMDNIVAQLSSKGYQYVSSDGQLVINLMAQTKMSTRLMPAWGFNYGWGWGGNGWNLAMIPQNVSVQVLVLDVVDLQNNALVWQSKGQGEPIDEEGNKDDRIQRLVAKMLKTFPSKVVVQRNDTVTP